MKEVYAGSVGVVLRRARRRMFAMNGVAAEVTGRKADGGEVIVRVRWRGREELVAGSGYLFED